MQNYKKGDMRRNIPVNHQSKVLVACIKTLQRAH